MSKVLIPLANGCEELESVTLIDLLRRAQIEVITASLDDDLNITASRGVRLIADTSLSAVLAEDFDMIVLPGGQPGTDNLNADKRIHSLLQKMADKHCWIAAICAAPLVLAHAGILNGFRAVAYPGVLHTEQWPEIQLNDDAVVIDGHIITSRGPGTAMDFALTLIEQLTDAETRSEVTAGLVRS
ncbi:DJ-1 family glyoxalase III [Methylophaga sp. OBS3]|uniref:DJ-1 family glyoxalase III n=1 Tax=Methylophaga sp. OBS3 TaxID=2991934 RepID=UPI0022585B5C|nr:DJ-1 family glyoxalase III [Methylophaga sp. OBS3]MCX4189729.1 DJ-1/PfpI family protein [Methylophaga sp. OBS3]